MLLDYIPDTSPLRAQSNRQQPKSTYLLLGNVSLADTIVGISIIFGAIVDHNVSSFCAFQIGMLVAPAMVSIFSVGLIAVDRYIYIVHGLYYQRWFTTTKVRIGILCIWMIGIILGFLPAMGWVNTEHHSRKCFYVYLFPGSLILLNSLLSIIPIVVVAVLYSIILVKALANVNKIRAVKKSATKQKDSQTQMPQLRIYRAKSNAKNIINNRSMKTPSNYERHTIKRSISFNNHYENQKQKTQNRSFKSKSINDLNENDHTKINDSEKIHESMSSSEFSICTIESNTDPNYSQSDVSDQPNRNVSNGTVKRKIKEPNKLRAITVVMLTSAIFISSLPAMGWTGKSFRDYRCWYISLFPSWLLIIVSVLVLSVIVMVSVLYILILHSAVKTVDKIREYRETNSFAYINKAYEEEYDKNTTTNTRTKITITISKDMMTKQEGGAAIEMRERSKIEEQQIGNIVEHKRKVSKIQTYYGQAKVLNSHPSKLKAVKTVLIVILCFMGTWAPYYVTVIIYVRCDILVNGYECLPLEILTLGPLFMLGVCNSLLDPIIYAWRHSGFKKTLRKMYLKYIRKLKAESFNN